MKGKILFQFCMLFVTSYIYSNPIDQLKTSHPRMQSAIDRIAQLPETTPLLMKATADGPIFLSVDQTGRMPFEAKWEGGQRRIVLDGKRNQCLGKMICNILFELHNAATDRDTDKLVELAANGEIDCDAYVCKSEKIEHDNVLSTVALIDKGIAQRIFPKCTHWEVIKDFDIHYQVQQLSEHSLYIAREFEQLKPQNKYLHPYIGTVKNLHKMNYQQKMNKVSDLYNQYYQTM